MKRISILAAAMAAMAMGAAPASAQLPIPEQPDVASVVGGAGGDAGTGNVQVLNGNSAAVSALGRSRHRRRASDGRRHRRSRAATPVGGHGGSADTGNKQAGNGNSLAVSVGGKPERNACGKCGRHESKTRSEGGDTYAKSGDAYAGRGGDARGGKRHGDGHRKCDHRRKKDEKGPWDGPSRGAVTAATPSRQHQFLNGNSLALALFGDARSEGGDTLAKSGDAYGGHGGDAGAL